MHLAYVRDGGPVACDCVIGHNHDLEDPVVPGRKRVEIDLEHYQEAVKRMSAALRDMKPALDALNRAMKDMNLAFHHVLEATQADPMPIYDPESEHPLKASGR